MPDHITFAGEVYERLLNEVIKRHPVKTFGYLLSAGNPSEVTDFILFDENIRNSDTWQPEFHSYGYYFAAHHDAGFVATPEEAWRVQKEIWARGLCEVGVLHSHQRHPANFSEIDWDMHRKRFCELWHLIISMRNPDLPQVRAFAVSDDGVRLLPVRVTGQPGDGTTTATRDAAIREARLLTRPDRAGRPSLANAGAIMSALWRLRTVTEPETVRDVLADSVFAGSAERFATHIAPLLQPIAAASFEMGTDQAGLRHFYGESPRHRCGLSAFRMLRIPVTSGLFALIDPDNRTPPREDLARPVVNVTWAEAALFALWMGCRLPTEAQWEYCCGAGAPTPWCCGTEDELARYAWYCVNSRDQVQAVATREPNALGLFDMHGNVWEWCQDDYDQHFYGRSPWLNPVNLTNESQKSVRGGAMNALPEMCRTRFRFHEAAGFWATDLGFRLAAPSAC
jgi:formylglycine-generating enzyme required for sulfatase activity/proteasome lid subunit RPN8/RPN11